ncbi:DUF4013 domain-containing protein [candidate division WOR-3 bacterium]|nr:DUF4013 domain-containing protein [candidate division WOR-3 bacterium]
MDIKKDLEVIFKDKEWVKKTLIGSIFLMLPILDLLSFGFLARFIYTHLEEGKKKLPSWDHWGNLLLEGFEWGLIIIIYLAIPLLVLSFLPESLFAFVVNPAYVIGKLNLGGYIFLTLSALLTFIVLFFLPMALILFADSESFLSAFHLEKIFKHIKQNLTHYLIVYILSIILFGFAFCLHILLNTIHFGALPSYFIFMWIVFIALLISESLFIETF